MCANGTQFTGFAFVRSRILRDYKLCELTHLVAMSAKTNGWDICYIADKHECYFVRK